MRHLTHGIDPSHSLVKATGLDRSSAAPDSASLFLPIPMLAVETLPVAVDRSCIKQAAHRQSEPENTTEPSARHIPSGRL